MYQSSRIQGLRHRRQIVGRPCKGTGSPARGMPDRNELDSFIGNSFRSVWALELLKYLAENPGTYHTPDELIAVLRASEAVVSQSVRNLSAAGLAVVDDAGRAAYHEGSV